MIASFAGADWWALLAHFTSLSLLAIGGAITTAPEMHSYLVNEKSWLTDSQFTSSIALAQAAPGPNVLFIALLGWNVGMNAGGGMGAGVTAWWMALAGVGIAMIGILLPSTTMTLVAARWAQQNRELRAVRAFKQGMGPIVIALLIATAWIMVATQGSAVENWRLWFLATIGALAAWRTRLHMLWLLGLGAVAGASGLL
jgi:chromate transporter